jgi:hypothetical protein
MKRISSLIAAVGLLAVVAAGCSQDAGPAATSGTATDDYAKIDLNQEFGGLTATDEEAAFADSEMMQALAGSELEGSDDPMALHPDVVRMDRMGRDGMAVPDSLRPRLTFVRLRWGHLTGPVDSLDAEDGCGRTDWSGTLRVDRGLLVIRRVLAFERPADHLVFPRLDGRTVALVSHTGCGHDGLVLQVLERPAALDDSARTDGPNFLHIALGPYIASFDLAELASIDDIVEVDASGNSFQLTGLHPGRPDACPSGFLSGRYRPAPTDSPDSLTGGERTRLGGYAGMWRELDGRVHGFVRGAYGLNDAGEHVFVGKVIGPRGHFRGLIRGTWEPGAREGDLAHFSGRWFNAAGTVEGVLAGDGHPVEGVPGGWFGGRWSTLCDEQAAESVN